MSIGFKSLKPYVDAYTLFTAFRKTPSVVTAAGYWMDLSMSPGNPKPNYYASTPLISDTLSQSTDGGIFHGAAPPAGNTKHLRRMMLQSIVAGAANCKFVLCDYLLYYPFIDESDLSGEQLLNKDIVDPKIPTRYADGAGVQMMAVVVAGHVGSGATFTVRYTNQNGDQNRTSLVQSMNVGQFVNGTILNTAPATPTCNGPFIPLQKGDTGVRSVQGVTIQSIGDVGLFTLVLVKPLADIALRGNDAPVEVNYLDDRMGLPRIMDDAYLNFIASPAGSLSAAGIFGNAYFVWS